MKLRWRAFGGLIMICVAAIFILAKTNWWMPKHGFSDSVRQLGHGFEYHFESKNQNIVERPGKQNIIGNFVSCYIEDININNDIYYIKQLYTGDCFANGYVPKVKKMQVYFWKIQGGHLIGPCKDKICDEIIDVEWEFASQ